MAPANLNIRTGHQSADTIPTNQSEAWAALENVPAYKNSHDKML